MKVRKSKEKKTVMKKLCNLRFLMKITNFDMGKIKET